VDMSAGLDGSAGLGGKDWDCVDFMRVGIRVGFSSPGG